ncbi:sensor histidine kinase [Rhodopirellula bahusiensis]|uniref:histidine kinase n=1 Tax=Rhodopirellula bahusiensis TaxID=2014065 RepID=A0A2G1WD02_9BACT|nr:ATP-binding protein [Rhodopirellula bahusiensis]PHQ36876.1 hypothetical protein CEE69_00315 [Rhodopirellula bahusiensis]
MNRISIRWRIAVWSTLAFGIVLFAFAALLYGMLYRMHYRQVDDGLKNRFEKVRVDLETTTTPDQNFANWVRKFGKHLEISGVAVAPDGRIVAAANSLNQMPDSEWKTIVQPGPVFDSQMIPGFGHGRLARGSIETPTGTHTLILVAEMEHIDEELRGVAKVLWSTIPLMLVMVVIVSYVLAMKALSPVEQLTQRSNEITAENLHQRLPVPNPHDELGHLAKTINSMISRLEKSFAEVRRFSDDASHELRTPVTIIQSEAEMGLELTDVQDEASTRFKSILEECSRLTAVTSQLLALSRSESSAAGMKLASIDLEAMAEEVIRSLQPRITGRQLSLALIRNGPMKIESDQERVRQVFHNLLENSIKYTPTGGNIEVVLTHSSNLVNIEFRDSGIGIGAEHSDRIFDRFYKAHSGDEGLSSQHDQNSFPPSTGLGLSIVRSILDSLGGEIELIERPPWRTVFQVSLPTKPS